MADQDPTWVRMLPTLRLGSQITASTGEENGGIAHTRSKLMIQNDSCTEISFPMPVISHGKRTVTVRRMRGLGRGIEIPTNGIASSKRDEGLVGDS